MSKKMQKKSMFRSASEPAIMSGKYQTKLINLGASKSIPRLDSWILEEVNYDVVFPLQSVSVMRIKQENPETPVEQPMRLKKSYSDVVASGSINEDPLCVVESHRRRSVSDYGQDIQPWSVNLYYPSVIKKSLDAPQPVKCLCKHSGDCSKVLCPNRVDGLECDVNHCGDQCTNTRITNGQPEFIEKFRTEHKGFGLRATGFHFTGEIIMELTGIVMMDTEYMYNNAAIFWADPTRFTVTLNHLVLLCNEKQLSNFINHSCSSNCEFAIVMVKGLPRFVLKAKRDIPSWEELTVDYFIYEFISVTKPCYCEERLCRGRIGVKPYTTIYSRRMTAAFRDNENFNDPNHVIPDMPSKPDQ